MDQPGPVYGRQHSGHDSEHCQRLFWNDKFVFTGNANDWRSKLKRLGKTYVSYGGTSILSNVLLWIEVAFFSVSKSIAPIVNLLVTIPLNFVINKLWTFKEK